MKILLLTLWLCVAAVPVFAQNSQGQNNNQGQNGGGVHAAPADLIGVGIPSALAVGGVLLGARLLGRRRR